MSNDQAPESVSITSDDFKELMDRLHRLVMLIKFDGTIVYWNAGGEEIFGYTEAESIGRNVWFLFPHRSREIFKNELEALRKGELVSGILEGRHKDGRTIWLDSKRRMIKLQNGSEFILGSVSDITPQIIAGKEAGYHRERLESILESAVEGIITIDVKGKIQALNTTAEKIFGYKSGEVIGKNVSILMPDPYREEHDSYIQNYLRTGERKIIGKGREVRGRRKDGSVFPMELSVTEVRFEGEIIFTGMVSDVTMRRRMENEILRIGEEERKRIGQDLHDGLGQMLTGIGLISQNLARKLKANALPGAEEAQEIYEMLREADEQAKAMAHGLVQIDLEEGRIADAIHNLCNRAKRLFNISFNIDLNEDFDIEDNMSKHHLYRIVQESISNAVKHGKASSIKVILMEVNEYIRLIVEDNGIGFEASGKQKVSTGMGINTMKYRAHILGGHLRIHESEEGNTRIICTIPKTEFKERIKK